MNADPTVRDGARPYPTRAIIYADGRVIVRQSKIPMDDIAGIIGAGLEDRAPLDSVNLRDGHVMLVHDLGHTLQLPVNPGATAAYHAVCLPGTTHEIRGVAVIVPDEDFA